MEGFKIIFDNFKAHKIHLLKEVDEAKKTILHRSCEKGNIEITKFILNQFLENGLSIESRDDSNCTPLDLACV